MRKVLIACLAAATVMVAMASPAAAQWRDGDRYWRGGHWRGERWGPGVVLSIAPPVYGYYNAYATEPNCEVIRERRIRPNGTVERRTIERCY